ncbi:MAG: cytochrome-c peroxidase [Methyloligellaceae bacterium]
MPKGRHWCSEIAPYRRARRAAEIMVLVSVGVLALAGLARAGEDPARGIAPVEDADFHQNARFPETVVRLGQLLFFDPILSGNRNISCATCHHPRHGTSDGVSLSFGEGATGLGRKRQVDPRTPVVGRIGRNAQALYFLGAREYMSLFHDGRVERDPKRNWKSGFWSPAREQLPAGLDNVLAAQALFPVISDKEMAGQKGENPVATAVALDKLDGPDGAWALLARRLQANTIYVELFKAAFPEIRRPEDITFVHAANAIAAFETQAFRPDKSLFDRYLRTRNPAVLGSAAWRGLTLFYGRARCSTCHGGKFQTDHKFRAIAMPQIGPGKNDGHDQSYWQATGFKGRLEDFGRYRVTFEPEDRFRFRTPGLRNVALTGPWGHNGAYASLEAVVRHHLDPVRALERYDVKQAKLPRLRSVMERTAIRSRLIFRPVNPARLDDYLRRDGWVQQRPELRHAIATRNELKSQDLSDQDVADLVAFLEALTDPKSRDRSDLIPDTVPSGLPIDK